MELICEENGRYSPTREFSKKSHLHSFEEYNELYKESINKPEIFWPKMAKDYYWKKNWDEVYSGNINVDKGPIVIEWFKGAKTNLSYNCLDRHLEKNAHRIAYYWEGNEPGESQTFTYKEIYTQVCQLANTLKDKGVKKGDRVALYMPMIPELVISTLACARIGAVHSVVFGGFSADSLGGRIHDSQSKVVLTADGCMRGKKFIPIKEITDKAIENCVRDGFNVETVIVVSRLGSKAPANINMQKGRDFWWHDTVANANTVCEPEWMDAEDPLFILYTSGSTGKPKGVLHTTAGYMVYAGTTFKYVFDYQPDDIYWCTADIGWVTGHSYIVYGPMANAATQVIFEGIPTYPDAGRFWDIVDKYKVSIFYTAPTAIRALAAQGDEFVKKHNRSSLRLLGTVGEPINPEAWRWYHQTVGDSRCPIVDTWWQTETGGILITPLPGAIATKPGSATFPFFGIDPVILDPETGKELEGDQYGVLAIKNSWPGEMRTIFGDHDRFEKAYFSAYKGYYFTGDGCHRDKDGYLWITGRVDDVINVSGHRIGTAEVESSLVAHHDVAEAAVVGFPHDIKGQGIYAYVTLNHEAKESDELKKELCALVRKDIGAFAAPDEIHWAPALPKTRSGKIMRRILRKIAANDLENLGDTSTLADPSVVDALKETR